MSTRLQNTLSKPAQLRLLRIITHAGALIPLALLLWDYWFWTFGPDPIREITLRTGKAALVLLVLSLACTPLSVWLGWKIVVPLRKPLGLYAFLYVTLHLLTFVWLDYGWNFALLPEAIFEKRYALAGFAAFLLLVPLAATSTKWAMRKLGRRWKQLHKLVYAAVFLALVHYFWLVKNVYTQPLIFAAIVAVLLLTRVPPIRRRITAWRKSPSRKKHGRSVPAD